MPQDHFWPLGGPHEARPENSPTLIAKPGSQDYFKDMMLDYGLVKLPTATTAPILDLCKAVWLAARKDLIMEQERAKRP